MLKGNWNDEALTTPKKQKLCPNCGFPLQYRYKLSLGLPLYICTNEEAVCGFITNEYKALNLSILKCDKCTDGYMIVKPTKDSSFFLGWTNYKKDKTGCNNIIWKNEYYNAVSDNDFLKNHNEHLIEKIIKLTIKSKKNQ